MEETIVNPYIVRSDPNHDGGYTVTRSYKIEAHALGKLIVTTWHSILEVFLVNNSQQQVSLNPDVKLKHGVTYEVTALWSLERIMFGDVFKIRTIAQEYGDKHDTQLDKIRVSMV